MVITRMSTSSTILLFPSNEVQHVLPIYACTKTSLNSILIIVPTYSIPNQSYLYSCLLFQKKYQVE